MKGSDSCHSLYTERISLPSKKPHHVTGNMWPGTRFGLPALASSLSLRWPRRGRHRTYLRLPQGKPPAVCSLCSCCVFRTRDTLKFFGHTTGNSRDESTFEQCLSYNYVQRCRPRGVRHYHVSMNKAVKGRRGWRICTEALKLWNPLRKRTSPSVRSIRPVRRLPIFYSVCTAEKHRIAADAPGRVFIAQRLLSR